MSVAPLVPSVKLKFVHDRLRSDLAGTGADLVQRQEHREPGTSPRSALYLDSAGMRLDDPGNETQTQAETLIRTGSRTRARNAIEAVENVGQILVRNAASGIFHHD